MKHVQIAYVHNIVFISRGWIFISFTLEKISQIVLLQ